MKNGFSTNYWIKKGVSSMWFVSNKMSKRSYNPIAIVNWRELTASLKASTMRLMTPSDLSLLERIWQRS
eukprot:CAMPEP_0185594838 /NCGR_PEP_ID=MMETSP0434-20130131/76287_1 /TAXON_ID=626734 ORGANISM="Favella taraikaensis, Strain Fe Narragansett Bay" /NCGR_SAMPLE_ID=MMETSP0434 /ASSEMBLY_ACC=CAM_ASM_000379 /LENGTH=68 /DNA_ID=CAMNT_0028222427 /DNA_START=652 /DNA_END=858 /DNA_ORIENTATION=-